MSEYREMAWRTIGQLPKDNVRLGNYEQSLEYDEDHMKVMGGIAPDGAPMNRGVAPWPYLSNGGSNPRYLSFIHWLGVNLHDD